MNLFLHTFLPVYRTGEDQAYLLISNKARWKYTKERYTGRIRTEKLEAEAELIQQVIEQLEAHKF